MPDEKGKDWLNLQSFIILCIAMAVVVAGAAIGYSFLASSHEENADQVYEVKNGDQVEVDYIGMFEDGTVFDTSIEEVADNNALYPKSLSFAPQGDFTPLGFTVGAGEMIPGFDSGVVGMVRNETRILTIQPEDGYGFPSEDMVQTKSLRISIPVYEWTVNTTSFAERYFVDAELGTTIKHDEYGWNATVSHIDPVSGLVMMKNEPNPHEIIKLYNEWDSMVVSIDTSANGGMGEIVVKHLLTSADAGKIISADKYGQFIVRAVNADAGTYTVDYNREVVGKTLIFKVTMVFINPVSQNP